MPTTSIAQRRTFIGALVFAVILSTIFIASSDARIIRNAARGAVIGAGIGAIVDGGNGAARGAAVGAVIGAVQ